LVTQWQSDIRTYIYIPYMYIYIYIYIYENRQITDNKHIYLTSLFDITSSAHELMAHNWLFTLLPKDFTRYVYNNIYVTTNHILIQIYVYTYTSRILGAILYLICIHTYIRPIFVYNRSICILLNMLKDLVHKHLSSIIQQPNLRIMRICVHLCV